MPGSTVVYPGSGSGGGGGGAVTAPVRIADGSAGSPSYSFSGQTGTGLYRATNTVGLAVNGVAQLLLDSTGSATLAGDLLQPATAQTRWSGRGRLASPADGFVQILNNAGGNSASLAMGCIIGTDDASGLAIARNGTNIFQFMNGNRTANASLRAASFTVTNADLSLQYGSAAYGMGIGTTSMVFIANSVTALTFASTGNATFAKPVTVGSAAADPAGADGMIYYDSAGNRLRAYVGGAWKTVTVA